MWGGGCCWDKLARMVLRTGRTYAGPILAASRRSVRRMALSRKARAVLRNERRDIARHFYRRPGPGRSLSSNVEQRESLSHAGCDDGCAAGLMRRNRARVGCAIDCLPAIWLGYRQAFATTRRVLLNDRGRGMLRRAGLRGCVERAGLFQHGLGQDAQVLAQAFHAAHQ